MSHCDRCHGAGPVPDWSREPGTITAIRFTRRAHAYHGHGIERVVDYTCDGRAERAVTLTGEVPPEGMGSLTDVASSHASAELPGAEWSLLADAVAASGQFRYEGEAVTLFATHCEAAFVIVSREDREDCVLGCMAIDADEHHPTFFALLDRLDALEQSLAWRADDG